MPLPAGDISKPAGAVRVTSPVKLLPDTVNCSKLGLEEAVPAQAKIAPDTRVDTIVGGGVGFTVNVKVTGAPLHVLLEIKLPNENVALMPGMIATTVLVCVLITETVPETKLAT